MANNYGILFLNKVIQSEDIGNFNKYGIDEESFVSKIDRDVYRFIEEYYSKYGDVPSYATVSDNIEDFVYIPNITDRFEALSDGVLDRKLAVEFNRVFEEEFPKIKSEQNTNTSDIISHLTAELDHIRMKYTNTRTVGRSAKDTEAYLAEYKKRQAGESHKVWKSFMPSFNEVTDGYASSNFYTIFARSGRGKSVFAIREALESAMQGATVLYWALEMDYYSVMTRLYSMLSAKLGKTLITTKDGEKLTAGFGTKDLRQGTLTDDFEISFEEMLATINEHIPGEVIIRSKDDPEFNTRTVDQLEADARSINADIIFIDPLYLLTFEANKSRTSGGDASATSEKLMMLTGRLDVPIIGITQAEEAEEGVNDEDIRELKIPKRSEVKKTSSFLEDASVLIGLDSDYTQNRMLVGIVKGRNGGESMTMEGTFIPSYGVVEELVIDESMFDF